MIKKYDDFINEELDWSNIKRQIIKAIGPFNGNFKEMKEIVIKLLKRGILPVIILSSLSYYLSEDDSKSLVKQAIEEYDDGYGVIRNEIDQSKLIVFNKIKSYKNKDLIIKKLNEIDIVVGDIIMGDDSTPRTILSLTNGKEMMYDIISNKGKIYTVNESHIL
jgi:regulator of RNase E activity RraB